MSEQNFLSPINFRFVINRLPNVAFYIQQASIPGISMIPTESPSPFAQIYRHGDRLLFNEFSIIIRVDEDMESYREIYDWMTGVASPEGFDGYETISQGTEGIYSDATLTILNSSQNPNIEVTYRDMFPIQLGDVSFNTTATDLEFATCDITFRYARFDIKKLG